MSFHRAVRGNGLAFAVCMIVCWSGAAVASPAVDFLAAITAQLPPGEQIPTTGLGDPVGFLSPPFVRRPYFVCADVIAVSGVLPDATVELEFEIAGQLQSLTWPAGDGGVVQIELPSSFQTSVDWIRARQVLGQEISGWDWGSTSPDNHALDVDATYPDGLPIPVVYWEPYFDCGIRVGVTNFISGSNVWTSVHPQGAPEYNFFSANRVAVHAVEGEGPAFHATDELRSHYTFCGRQLDSSLQRRYEVVPLPALPNGPPAPLIRELFVDDRRIVVGNLMHGARVYIYDQPKTEVAFGSSASDSIGLGARRPLVAGESLSAVQIFEGCGPESQPGPATTVQPCSALRAPVIHRPAPGDEEIAVVHSQPSAVIAVYDQTGQLIGRGVAPRVPLSRPLTTTEELRIIQILGSCVSSTAYRIHVDCGPKGRGELDLLNQISARKRRRAATTLNANECQ